jgi:cysteine desulfurase / selenocysteine lyase
MGRDVCPNPKQAAAAVFGQRRHELSQAACGNGGDVQELGASAGRGAYNEAIETGALIAECRQRLNRFFNGGDPNHFVFTLNCTDALHLAIKGLVDPRQQSHAICTNIDHNSILRPLSAMEQHGRLEQTRLPVDSQTGLVDPDEIRRAIRRETKLIAITHASNVTGTVQPIRAIAAIAREHEVPLVVDAAQSAGHVPIDLQADGIDLLAAPGHKALMGPLGTGVLYIRPGIEKVLRTVREGGTGSLSEEPHQPAFMPDRYESGSHNAIGIAGLAEGVKWLIDQTIEKLHEHEMDLLRTFIDGVSNVEGLRYFGPQGVRHRLGVFSVHIDGLYGILTRSGIHCAPLAHETIGTANSGGTTRLSFGPFLTRQDVFYATNALAEIAMRRSPVSVR